MKERRSKRNRAAGNKKKNEKEGTSDQENSDWEHASHQSESDANSSEEKVQKKKPKRGQRCSTRKVNKKSLSESSVKEDESIENSENSSNKKEFGRKSSGINRSRKIAVDEDEINGEKVQNKRDLRISGKAIENENEKKNENEDKDENKDENENKEEEGDVENEEFDKPVKSLKKGLKRKSSLKVSEAKKLKVDDSEKNGESDVCPEETECSLKLKKNDGKKHKGKASEATGDEDDEDEAESEEYEVEKLVDIYFKKNGKREFLVRWKGYSSKDDTWEPEKHLNCKELIDAFLEKCEKAKSIPMREMRTDRRKTERYIVHEELRGRKLSARLKHKPRKTYFDVE